MVKLFFQKEMKKTHENAGTPIVIGYDECAISRFFKENPGKTYAFISCDCKRCRNTSL